jgi:DNA-binding FrmR family transcriptional regulator
MTRDDSPCEDHAELLRAWKDALRDVTPAELHKALHQLMSTAADAAVAA